MVMVWEIDNKKAFFCGREFDITCDVRNELNGRRRLHDKKEVVNVVTALGKYGQAYMPRRFPKGRWEITAVEETSAPVFAPFKIKTTAHQVVDTWLLDSGGGYDRKCGKADDFGYYLHWCKGSKTTLGCGRVGLDTPYQVVVLAELIRSAWNEGETVFLEVSRR
jgi:hypothetical protein